MEAMTLEQIKDWHLKRAGLESSEKTAGMHARMAKALSAHLAQRAQAVDVVAYLAEDTGKPMSREIVDLHFPTDEDKAKGRLTPLTRALSGEKAGPVGSIEDYVTPAVKRALRIPASPTPDKEG